MSIQNGQVPPFEKVTVFHWFIARGYNGTLIDIRQASGDLQQKLLDAKNVYSGFLVFFQDRQFSLSDYYLPSGWRYNNNSNPDTFQFRKVTYIADYPIGWGVNECFRYLGKEIN